MDRPITKALKLLSRSPGSSSFNTFRITPPAIKAMRNAMISSCTSVTQPIPYPAAIAAARSHLP